MKIQRFFLRNRENKFSSGHTDCSSKRPTQREFMYRSISEFWFRIQGSLFPMLKEELGPITQKQLQLIAILETVRVEKCLPSYSCWSIGRPRKSRAALARAFVAKAFYNFPTTRALIDRIQSDVSLRRICGWETRREIPDESTFSRVFAEFAKSQLPKAAHKALVSIVFKNRIVGHISRDSTAIHGRERPVRKKKKAPKKRGRPRKGEERLKEEKRLDKQLKMSYEEMLKDLPKQCDTGAKANSKGNKEYWIGYKFHIDTADGDIPLSGIVTSASIHDSQVAIPLAEETATKVVNLYDLMDAAYDAPQIKEHSKKLQHVPIIDKNCRKHGKEDVEREAKARKTLNWSPVEKTRYNQRSSAERVNARLKDEFGGRMIRVRGHPKVACHLMFGLLALTADAILNLVR